jgi:hypothetical protein
MRIEATALRGAIADGIERRRKLSMLLTNERGDSPKPEYLTTACVCMALGDFVERSRLENRVKIHAEELTKDIWGRERAHALLSLRNASKAKRRKLIAWREQRVNSGRKGNVDIMLVHGGAMDKPFAVIENKGTLTFRQDGQLGAGSEAEIRKDLLRNLDFFTRRGPTGGVEYAALTGFLRDENSHLREHGRAFCAAKKKFFQDYVGTFDLPDYLRIDVLVETYDEILYETEATAQAHDENGAPAIDTDSPWHIAHVIISMYHVGLVVNDEQDLAGFVSMFTTAETSDEGQRRPHGTR